MMMFPKKKQNRFQLSFKATQTSTFGDGMKQVKVDTVQYEMLLAVAKRWRMKPEDLIAELIEENYNNKSKR